MNEPVLLRVDVVYAKPDAQFVVALQVPPGTTVTEAIRRSGLLARFPEIDLEKHGVGRSRHSASRDTSTSLYVGIFGEFVSLADPLRDGDRVEIYRPLLADPKVARRNQAEKKKKRR